MNESRNIPWLRISVEGVAVVVSILFAFAIDAWWVERLDRISERQELQRLQSEFTDNIRENPSFTGKAMPNARSASLQIYDLLTQAIDKKLDRIDVPGLLIADMLRTPTLDIETPVLDSLIRSGRIEKIRNTEILPAVTRWQRTVNNNAETERRALIFVDEQLLSAVMDAGDISHILLNADASVQVFELDPEGITSLSVDERLVELVAHRYFLTSRSILTRERIGRAQEQLLAAIANSLDP
jgi:hypothetical protein